MAVDGKWRSWNIVSKAVPRATLRFFCFPYGGGNASIYQWWHVRLPEQVEVRAIQLPGRANRIGETPFTRITDLVPVLTEALLPLLDRPFAFFGHSLGAILSFEVTRELQRRRSLLPKCLFVSGRRAPQIPCTDPPSYSKSDEDFLAYLDELNGTHPEVRKNAELLQLLLPVLRADFELGETYQYSKGTPLSCAITVFGGSDDEETSHGWLEGWRLQTSGKFSQHILSGGHFFIHANEDELLKVLHAELSQLSGR